MSRGDKQSLFVVINDVRVDPRVLKVVAKRAGKKQLVGRASPVAVLNTKSNERFHHRTYDRHDPSSHPLSANSWIARATRCHNA